MREPNSLKILQKAETLIIDLLPALRKFPKVERYTLAQEIEKECLEFVKHVHIAAYEIDGRLIHLKQARSSLQLVGFLLRLSRRQAFISEGFYELLTNQNIEIGKMLTGWIKTTQNRMPPLKMRSNGPEIFESI
jgi:hypothetical protein